MIRLSHTEAVGASAAARDRACDAQPSSAFDPRLTPQRRGWLEPSETSAPATHLAERAPAGYITTPTIRPLRGARWLLTTLLTGFPTTGRAHAVFCPRGAAAWTAAIRACPRRWSAAGRARGAWWPIGAAGRSGDST